jgi:transcriptional regulator with XRE-family HTH domain
MRMPMRISKMNIPGLAERAKTLRHSIGLSQQIVATKAGISPNRLRDLETQSIATLDTIAKVAAALGVGPEFLIGARGIQ